MSYRRVIPRDLFNEAKLLKCFGRLYIEAERHQNIIVEQRNEKAFDVQQDASSGALYVDNLRVTVRGVSVHVYTAYNSKSAWPMYADYADECIAVFDDEGGLTDEFLAIE
jgi:NADPH-dependent 7-cyano-7-deazaguanine reductase QueF